MNYEMRKFKIFFFLILFFGIFGWVQSSQAATYYVAKNGNDNNVGTEANPWLTIQKAANTLVAGDTVYVKEGTYNEMVSAKNSGSPGNYITYAVYPGHKVIIDAQSVRNEAFLLSGSSQADYVKVSGFVLKNGIYAGMYVAGRSNVMLENLEATGNQKIGGIYINKSKNIKITGAYAHHNGTSDSSASGIYVADLSDNVEISNSRAEYNRKNGFTFYSNANYSLYPSDAQIASRNLKIENSDASYNGTQGIWVQRGLNVLVKGNRTFANGATGIQIETGTKYIYVADNISYANNRNFNYETGIWIDETQYGVVENNTIYESQKGLYLSQSYYIISRNNKIFNNKSQWTRASCTGCPVNSMGIGFSWGHAEHLGAPFGAAYNRFVHNTLYDNGAAASEQGGWHNHPPSKGPEIHHNRWLNNIVAQTTGKREAQLTDYDGMDYSDHNIYFNSSRPLKFYYENSSGSGADYDFAGWKSKTGFDANSLSADPKFANAASHNFSLQTGSPAIDKGGWLARAVGAGSGKILKVDDPYVFADGYGISGVSGDVIKLEGSSQTAKVVKVDYANKTLTLDNSLTWSDKQGIAYNFSGARPDIGAYEYQGTAQTDTTPPAAPSGFAVK